MIRHPPSMLPDVIEIVPLLHPAVASITVPGSKSITNRVMILGALSDGECVLKGALWSEDTQVMATCLEELGYMVRVEHDLLEHSNRTITIYGKGAEVPPGGSINQPLDLFVGNAGTAARFLAALVCLGRGVYRLHGVPRMHQRPQAGLFAALRQLGYVVESANDHLPAVIHGAGPRPGTCSVSISESSQFASALILASNRGKWNVSVQGENAEESPYVRMTQVLADSFPRAGGEFLIEPDASSGSYFWGAADLFREGGQSVRVLGWPKSDLQIDARFPGFLPGTRPSTAGSSAVREISRLHDLGDSIMTAIVLSPLWDHPVRFTDLGRLRVQECERVEALRSELTKCGARIREQGDTLAITPGELHGAEIETYNDHRMAMCFGMLGLRVPGIRLKNPSCVKKTFPDFFRKLGLPPPIGLGASLLDRRNGKLLPAGSLVAD